MNDYELMRRTITDYVKDPKALREVLHVLAFRVYEIYGNKHGNVPSDAAHDISQGLSSVANLTEWIGRHPPTSVRTQSLEE